MVYNNCGQECMFFSVAVLEKEAMRGGTPLHLKVFVKSHNFYIWLCCFILERKRHNSSLVLSMCFVFKLIRFGCVVFFLNTGLGEDLKLCTFLHMIP
ncbi:hypothetical protein ISN45_At04g013070 [Arabidopsis thaliana x Arabidopsis arenosa]|uniref:Transmembrane protein n=1 Tax=Arabidopsis thaliana x Arabidopsis arenosa TaxID=1240361 RepID=A0A8T2DZT0_9BRAS|nr:hypothetical protein ISN45_At04g013070 [Arabidopsis thaliana x Arabidopsis arenosa]KAG7615761.1 hypothetical protein ISN45_At04g013070 [Arabidopsis thaliana x Arabidopsis arenosa]